MANWDLYESRLNKNGSNTRDRQINYMKDGIINSFKSTPSFREVYFNNETIITEVQITDTLDYNIKTVLMKPNENIFIGDMLYFDNNNWLCTKIDFTNPVYEIGTVQKCNNTINLYKNNMLYKIPIVVESGVRLFQLGSEDSKFITTPSTLIVVRIPFNEITMGIKRGDIYKIGVQNWKVEDVNDIIEQGLLIVRMEYSQESQEEYNYNLTILNGDSIQISQSQSLIINAQLTKNDIIVPSPSLVYTSSDESIATIDNNGLVDVLGIGNVVFSVILENDISITASISVEIIADEVDNFTYLLTSTSLPDDEIIMSQFKDYEIQKYNNGVLVNQDFTFNVVGDKSTYELINIDGNNCRVKALKGGFTITLRATDNSNSNITEKNIKLKNLF